MGWTTGVQFPPGAMVGLLFAIASRPALGPAKPPYPLDTEGCYRRGKAAGNVKLTTYLHLVPSSLHSTSQYVFVAGCLVKHRHKFTFCQYDSIVNVSAIVMQSFYIWAEPLLAWLLEAGFRAPNAAQQMNAFIKLAIITVVRVKTVYLKKSKTWRRTDTFTSTLCVCLCVAVIVNVLGMSTHTHTHTHTHTGECSHSSCYRGKCM